MEVKEVEERIKRGESVQMDTETAKKFIAAQNARNYEDGIIAADLLPSPIQKDDIVTFLTRYGNNATRFALFLYLKQHYLMTADAFAFGLRAAYVNSFLYSRDVLLDLFEELPDRFTIMTPEERYIWEALPTYVTI